MFSAKFLLTSAAFLAAITCFSQQAQATLCKVPREQDLPRNYATYYLTGNKTGKGVVEWKFEAQADLNPSAPKNVVFSAHIEQDIKGSLVVKLVNTVKQGPAPRKNYFYAIAFSKKETENSYRVIDMVKYWLNPKDNCQVNYDLPSVGNAVQYADDIQIVVNEYDVWLIAFNI